ncbi:hypothetical protein CDEF62S_02904 [Castellaniella defragrans]
MRILQINLERGWRGGERQTLLTLQGLRAHGHAAELLARAGDALAQRAASAGIPVHECAGTPGLWGFLARHGRRYDRCWQPAIIRQRTLAATFGYSVEGAPDFGLQALVDGVVAEPAALIMPSASRNDKLWPDGDWQRVFDDLQSRGLALRLLAGNDAERVRARDLIRGRGNAQVLPRMGLREVAGELARARIMVGLDSGLTHLSAGLGRPTIGIYRASTPVRTPLQGPAYTASLGERGQAPDAGSVCAAITQALDGVASGFQGPA